MTTEKRIYREVFWCAGCQRFIRRDTTRPRTWIQSWCEHTSRVVRLTLRKDRPYHDANSPGRYHYDHAS